MPLNIPSVDLSEEHAILLFQSVRELLMNIVKHAGTTEATQTVDLAHQTLAITVTDAGRGFDPLAEPAIPEPRYGLFSIRERMEAVGGQFNLASIHGQGTTATLSLSMHSAPRRSSSEKDASPSLSVNRASHVKSVRVLMVDDPPMVRQGLRAIVEQFDRIQVVGEAGNGLEAVQLVQTLKPDVAIIDVNMRTMDGIEATRQITACFPHVAVIGLSVPSSPQVAEAMKQAGAAAYLTKDAAPEQLHQAICGPLEETRAKSEHNQG